MIACSVNGCTGARIAKGYCKRHYQQSWKTGSPNIIRANPHGTPTERFWRYVTPQGTSECWEWTGHRDKDGYGTLRVGNTQVRAHRFSYDLHGGSADDLLRHSCDNPPCVNPAHLIEGSHQENMDDRMAAGNYAYATCRRGHPWTEASTIMQGRGQRTCKICRRMTPTQRKAFDAIGV
jgi:hypothetical protein